MAAWNARAPRSSKPLRRRSPAPPRMGALYRRALGTAHAAIQRAKADGIGSQIGDVETGAGGIPITRRRQNGERQDGGGRWVACHSTLSYPDAHPPVTRPR